MSVALKRLGLTLPSGFKPTTFGAMLAALSGKEPPASSDATGAPTKPERFPIYSAPQAAVAANGLAGLSVGLDVEDIRSLPTADDYWEHEFYRGNFSSSEVAYALLGTDPPTHFAGFWCAKEALRKCDRTFAELSPVLTAVAHESDGRPYLTLDTEAGIVRLPHALSISHAAGSATAIVVWIPPSAPAPTKLDATENSAPEIAEPAPASSAPLSPPESTPTPKKAGGLARLFAR
jgi:phosphopantetheinyl transferase (holo-ACP synthase)